MTITFVALVPVVFAAIAATARRAYWRAERTPMRCSRMSPRTARSVQRQINTLWANRLMSDPYQGPVPVLAEDRTDEVITLVRAKVAELNAVTDELQAELERGAA